MNYLFHVPWSWGTVRCVCQHHDDGATTTTVEIAESGGGTITLTPEQADAIADTLARSAADAQPIVTDPADKERTLTLPLGSGPIVGSKLRRAARLARAQAAPAPGPHPFVTDSEG